MMWQGQRDLLAESSRSIGELCISLMESYARSRRAAEKVSQDERIPAGDFDEREDM